MSSVIYDVVIVGGGPAGLSAALVLGRARRKVVLLDSGRGRNAAAQKLHGYLCSDGITPAELRRQGREEVERYGVEFYEDTVVSAKRGLPKATRFATCFEITRRNGPTLLGRKLLLATGVLDEVPDIPGMSECYGISVHHCPYCDGFEHAGKHLAAIGRSPSAAAKLATSLLGWSSHVTVLAHGGKVKPADEKLLAQLGIELQASPVTHVRHEQGWVFAIDLANGFVVPAEAIFFNTRQRQHSSLAIDLGCPLTEEEQVSSSPKQKTDMNGLFLAGDVDGDVQLAIVAAAEGATAAVTINRELLREEQQ